jgi:hypothetical protein
VGAENPIQAIDLGILCRGIGGHDRHRQAVRTIQSRPTCIPTWVLPGKRPSLDRRHPIRVIPVQDTWTTFSALTGCRRSQVRGALLVSCGYALTRPATRER